MPDTHSTVLPTDLEGDVLAEVDVSRHSQVIQFQHVWNSLKTVHEVAHLQIIWACAWGREEERNMDELVHSFIFKCYYNGGN